MKKLLFITLVFIIYLPLISMQVSFLEKTEIIFANVEQGENFLVTEDDFIERMSPFDRSARMKTSSEISKPVFLDFIKESILPWNEIEKSKLKTALKSIKEKIEIFSLPFPKEIYLIKTSGEEEGRAAYTRDNAIVLPENFFENSLENIEKTICHELFHILSRKNSKLKENLYSVIGFKKCEEIKLPAELENIKITNPDAPINDHYILLKVEGEEQMVIPILISSSQKYDTAKGGEFFNYLQFKFLLVEKNKDIESVSLVYEDNRPIFLELNQLSGFFEQVGMNTQYIIHPEEILADNFSILVLNKEKAVSENIINQMEDILLEVKEDL